MTITRTAPLAALALAAALAGLSAPASASEDDVSRDGDDARRAAAAAGSPVAVGTVLGSDMAAIAASLKERGLSPHEIERERGRFEVEIGEGRETWELYVDAETGAVTRAERED